MLVPVRSYWGHLGRVELVVVACLLAYALVLTLVLGLGAAVFAPGPQTWEGFGLAFGLILWFGILPATLLFAPAYAFLRWRGWINLALAIIAGLACGLIFIRAGPLALYAIASGVIVAICAHLVLRRMR